MQTTGPPTGLSIYLRLLRGTKAPSWALKAGVLCIEREKACLGFSEKLSQ